MMTNMDIYNLEQSSGQLPARELIERLSAILGLKLTVFLSGMDNISTLRNRVSKMNSLNDHVYLRLRYGYIAAAILTRNYGLETARTAFWGMNRYLDNEAPAAYLRNHTKKEDLEKVIGAARHFGEMGV